MKTKLLFWSCLFTTLCFGQTQKENGPLPVIDMHLHCIPVTAMLQGGMPDRLPSPLTEMSAMSSKKETFCLITRPDF